MQVCLFGGSFDPVHNGHLQIAEEAWKRCGLDRVVFLPAKRSPFKTEETGLFSDAQRVALLRTALQGSSFAELSEADLRLPPPSWSWRLVELWHAQAPQDELSWLMGCDQWEQLHRWARYDYLVEQLSFIVYHRGHTPQPRAGVRARFISGHHPASSSAIRAALLTGAPLPQAWMPPAAEALARHFLKGGDSENTAHFAGQK